MKMIFRSCSCSSAARAIARWALWTGSKVPPSRPTFNARSSAAHLAVAEDHVLERGEPLQPDRPARMQPVRGNADLGAQAVFVAVGEARRGVPHHRARVDLPHAALDARP